MGPESTGKRHITRYLKRLGDCCRENDAICLILRLQPRADGPWSRSIPLHVYTPIAQIVENRLVRRRHMTERPVLRNARETGNRAEECIGRRSRQNGVQNIELHSCCRRQNIRTRQNRKRNTSRPSFGKVTYGIDVACCRRVIRHKRQR